MALRVTARRAAGLLHLTFALEGDLAALRIGAEVASRRSDRLWEHTCFEAFVRAEGAQAYDEFNFAPTGEWAVYAFHAYRTPAPGASPEKPQSAWNRDERMLSLSAVVRAPAGPLRVATSAVLETADGRLTYWALCHPAARPDFHHPEAFAWRLDEARH